MGRPTLNAPAVIEADSTGFSQIATLAYAAPTACARPLLGMTVRSCCAMLAILGATAASGQIYLLFHLGGTLRSTLAAVWASDVSSDGYAGALMGIGSTVLQWLAIPLLLIVALRASARRMEVSSATRASVLAAGLLLIAASAADDFTAIATRLARDTGRSWREVLQMAAIWPMDAAFGALLIACAFALPAAASARFARRTVSIILLCTAVPFIPPLSYFRLFLTMWMMVFGDNGPSGWSQVVMYAAMEGGIIVAALLFAAALALWWPLRWQRGGIVFAACVGLAWQPALCAGLWAREFIAAANGGGVSGSSSWAESAAGIGEWSPVVQTVAFSVSVVVWTWSVRFSDLR